MSGRTRRVNPPAVSPSRTASSERRRPGSSSTARSTRHWRGVSPSQHASSGPNRVSTPRRSQQHCSNTWIGGLRIAPPSCRHVRPCSCVSQAVCWRERGQLREVVFPLGLAHNFATCLAGKLLLWCPRPSPFMHHRSLAMARPGTQEVPRSEHPPFLHAGGNVAKKATRRRYTEAEKKRILSIAQKEGLTGADVQKRFGIAQL